MIYDHWATSAAKGRVLRSRSLGYKRGPLILHAPLGYGKSRVFEGCDDGLDLLLEDAGNYQRAPTGDTLCQSSAHPYAPSPGGANVSSDVNRAVYEALRSAGLEIRPA